MQRREADRELWRAARSFWRDRRNPRKLRWAAFKIAAAFRLRIVLHWHSEPRPWLRELTGEFAYGLYCGVGHGVSEGETRDPIDKLDAACRVHDEAYQ